MLSIKLFKEQIINSKNIAIIGHFEPDADSLATAVSLKRCVLGNNDVFGDKQIDIFVEPEVIDSVYDPIIAGETFVTSDIEFVYDLAICVDCPTAQRMGKYAKVFEIAKSTIQLDHHESNENFANNNFVYKCSSTTELLYILLKSLNVEITNDILKLIYAGIITDTVNLTQGTVKVSSYKIVAEIAEKIGDIEALNAIKDHFLKNKSKSNLMLLEKALHSMQFYLNDRVAIMKLTKQNLEDADAVLGDTLGIVNHAINIKGVVIAILFIKQDDGSYYASIRGKNGVNVASIAVALGGGGSESVAAFTYGQNLSELKETLLKLCEDNLKDESGDDDLNNLFTE